MEMEVHLIIDGAKAFKRYVSWGMFPQLTPPRWWDQQGGAGLLMRGN